MTTPKCFVCTCEDVTEVEVREAIHKGFSDIESLKRYTGLATGPCQGKACVNLAREVLAREVGVDPGSLGAITFRPPVQPLPLGLLAGEERDGWASERAVGMYGTAARASSPRPKSEGEAEGGSGP